MNDEALRFCPFCKGEAELKEYKPNVSGVAICKECGARSQIYKNDHTGGWKPKAIAAWNTRTHGTLTAELVEKIVDRHCEWYEGGEIDAQAIVDELNVVLGSEPNPDGLPNGLTISDDGTLLNWRGENYVRQNTLGGGTLTAEQVRGVLLLHLPHREYYSIAQTDAWQAIADELNELGSGACEWVLEHSGTLYDKWRCSKCGYLFVESRTDQGIKEDFEPNFCPSCGTRIRKVVER